MHKEGFTSEQEQLVDMALASKGISRPAAAAIHHLGEQAQPVLSFAQQRIWFLERMHPGTATYNIPMALRVRGRLNVQWLRDCVQAIMDRHEVLRTVYAQQGGVPVPAVRHDMVLDVPVVELSGLDAAARDAEVQRLVEIDCTTPFDLEAGPLMRLTVLSLDAETSVLLFCVHHIAADGGSMQIIKNELYARYVARVTGNPVELPPLAVQYGDYATWQRDRLQGELLDAQLGYWTRRLENVSEPQGLLHDHARGPGPRRDATNLEVAFPASLHQGLRRIGAEAGTSLFMTCLAAFKVLVAYCTGQDDVVVGTPVDGRSRRELEPMVGMFVNTLALRSDLSGDPAFSDLLVGVRTHVLEAFRHQELPFEKLVDALGLARSAEEMPLIRNVFSMGSVASGGGANGGFEELPGVAPGPAKFDLTVIMVERENSLRAEVQYDTDLFEHTTIERLMQRYQRLLEAIVAAPGARLSTLAPLSAQEQSRLECWGRGATPEHRPPAVWQRFEAHVAAAPLSLAVEDGTCRLSYAELDAWSSRIGRRLQAAGVGPGALVAVAMERSAAMLAGMLGAWKAGAAFMPLDLGHPAERLQFIVEDAGAAALLERGGSPAPVATGAWLRVDVDALADDAMPSPVAARADTDVAYVLYTSGSSGRPKGVEVPHGALANLIAWFGRRLGLGAGDRCSQLAGAGFDASMMEWWGALAHGGSVHVVAEATRASPSALIDWLYEQAIKVAFVPTPLAQVALTLPWPAGMALRAVYVGGDKLQQPCPPGLPFRLYDAYGPTEATVVTTFAEVAPAEPGVAGAGIGHPIDGVQVRVLDGHGRRVPVGAVGELYIGGAGLACGYRNHPELTASSFVEEAGEPVQRWYRSGDRVKYREDGVLEFVGRVDDQVKLRGLRIELGEVRAALQEQASVAVAAVVVRGEGEGRYLQACVEAAPGHAPTAQSLREALSARLPGYMVPASILVLDAIPYTRNGKLDLDALPSEDGQRLGRVSPATPTEIAIAEIWSEVLDRPEIDVRDNFFGLGGHSLLATRVVARLEERLGVGVPLQGLFEEPVLAGLAAAIDSGRWGLPESPLSPIEPVSREDGVDNVFVQSHAQQRLWFLHQLDPSSTAYSVYTRHALHGEIDLKALQRSVDDLVARHESLRTTFAMEPDGRLVQVVAASASLRVAVAGFESLAPEDARKRAQQLIRNDVDRPFDLERGPLFRVTLLRFAPDRHMLLIGMHHIITDAWSMDIFLRELSQLYRGYRAGADAPLAPLPMQYADYACWQDGWLDFGTLEGLLGYWREHLRGAPPELHLVTDRVSHQRQINEGGVLSFWLGKGTADAVKRFADASGATSFMVLLAAFKALLSRYSDQEDIVVGVPVANRTRSELEPLVGFFVNTLVLRTRLSGDPGFDEIVNRVRVTTLGGFANQQLPLERLIERLEHNRRWQRSPLFRTMFVLQNAPQCSLELDGLEVEPLPMTTVGAKFDLTLAVSEVDGDLKGLFEYNADIFDRATVEQMGERFRLLLEAALARPRTRLSELPLLGRDEGDLLRSWGRGKAPAATVADVCERFEAHARARPDAVAVEQGTRSAGYAELDAWAGQIAHRLRERGIGPGDVVALGMERSVETAAGMLGVLKAGAAFLPLDVSHPPERLDYIVGDAGARAVLVCDGAAADQGFRGCERIAVDPSALGDADAGTTGSYDPASAAYVIYTSGSTGLPKGVEVSRGALANLADWYGRTLGIGPDDRCSQLAGAAFDANLLEWWGALAHGARACIVDDATRTSPDGLIGWLDGHAITHAFAPTPMAEAMLAEAWPETTALRALFVGGDRLGVPPTAGLPFVTYNAYGPTEAAVVTSCGRVEPDSGDGRAPHIGRPIQGIEVRVLDAAGHPVPVGIVGELYVGGTGLANGYRNHPELDAEAFVPDPDDPHGRRRLYRTGDRVRYRRDGNLEFVGRADDQVKIRGFRIEIGEVQSALRGQGGVRQACVTVREDVAGDRRLVGYVVPEDASTADPTAWMSGLRARLPAYMLPASLVTLDALPLNRSGKVDYAALPAPSAEHFDDANQIVPPRDFVEKQLVSIWESILNYSPASLHHNFFKFGGHSLVALSLRSAVESRLGVRIELFELFENGTIEHLARHVRALREARGLSAEEVLEHPRRKASRVGWLGRLLGRFRGGESASRSSRREYAPEEMLVRLAEKGSGTPLFLVQSIGGGLLCYADLVASLRGEKPVYGLAAPDAVLSDQHDIAGMAGLYVRALQAVQPHGPYMLGGWSLGGVVAFEVARQLEDAGERIDSLVLLDSYPFDSRFDLTELDDSELLDWFVKELLAPFESQVSSNWMAEVELGESEDALSQALAATKSLGLFSNDFTRSEFSACYEAYKASYRAWIAYRPGQLRAPIHVIAATETLNVYRRNPMQSWAASTLDGIKIDVVEGDHYSMLRAPVSERVIELLRAGIRVDAGKPAVHAERLVADVETSGSE